MKRWRSAWSSIDGYVANVMSCLRIHQIPSDAFQIIAEDYLDISDLSKLGLTCKFYYKKTTQLILKVAHLDWFRGLNFSIGTITLQSPTGAQTQENCTLNDWDSIRGYLSLQGKFFENGHHRAHVVRQPRDTGCLKLSGSWGKMLIHTKHSHTGRDQCELLRPRSSFFETLRELHLALFQGFRCICLAIDRCTKESIKSQEDSDGFFGFMLRSRILNRSTMCMRNCRQNKCDCHSMVMSRLYVAVRASVFLIFGKDHQDTDTVFFDPTVASTSSLIRDRQDIRACGTPDAFVADGSEHWLLHTHDVSVLCERPLTSLILAIDVMQNLPNELASFGAFRWLLDLPYWHDCIARDSKIRPMRCIGCSNFWLKLRWIDLVSVITSLDPSASYQLNRYIEYIIELSTRGVVDVRLCMFIGICQSAKRSFIESCVTWQLTNVISDSCTLKCWDDLVPLRLQPHSQMTIGVQDLDAWLLSMRTTIRLCQSTTFTTPCTASWVRFPSVTHDVLDWSSVTSYPSYTPSILALCVAMADKNSAVRSSDLSSLNWCKRLSRISTALDIGMIRRAFNHIVTDGYSIDWVQHM
jgi:hypothetical protein